MYDLVILGSGPAGLSAAIYAARAELRTIVIEKAPISGGQILNTYEVDNYPGYPGISGLELSRKLREHCERLGVNFITEEVVSVDVEKQYKKITTEQENTYLTNTLIVATGAICRKLEIPGEEQFAGMGVSYCATCDGAFFRNKTVAVVGGGDTAITDAIFLARLCKKVYIIHRRDELRAAKILTSKLMELENVEFLWNHTVEEICGDEMVKAIRVHDIKLQQTTRLDLDGIFIAIGTIPNTKFIHQEVAKDNKGYIVADETCKTNIPGIFAAGDVRTKQLRQIVTAAADGANAIYSVEEYLIRNVQL